MGPAPIPTKILLFGATGLIGKDILKALLEEQSSFEKIGIFTSAGTAESKKDELDELKAKGVSVIVGNVNSEADVTNAYKEFDTVISALGRSALLAQIPLITLADSSSSIHTFYPSEYGTDIEYYPHSVDEKPHQAKLKIRKHIRENVKNLHVTYLVTGPYSDLYISKRTGDGANVATFDPQSRRAVLLGTGDDPVSFTTMKDVGRLLVAALKHPADETPRALKVNSFTATPHEILAEFEKQTGAKWEVAYTPLDKLKEIEKHAWKTGSPVATTTTLARIWTEGGTLYQKRDNWKIGEPEIESLESQVKQAVAA